MPDVVIDASSPALVTGNSVTSLTTAAFTPPNDSELVAVSIWDTTGAVTPSCAVTNNGAALTWTLRAEMDQGTGTLDGMISISTAPLPVGRSITVTSTPSGTGLAGDERGGLLVFVSSNQHLTAPVGATGTGESTTNNHTPTVYTSTVDRSLCIGGASNKTDVGVPTSTDTETAFTIAFAVEGMGVYKASVTTPSGSAVTLNFDAVGTAAAEWNWAAIEMVPASGPVSIPIPAGSSPFLGRVLDILIQMSNDARLIIRKS